MNNFVLNAKRADLILSAVTTKGKKNPSVYKGGKWKLLGKLVALIMMGVSGVYCCCCLVAKSYLTLCNPMNCSPSASSVHGIL